jgi:hypothetical protein
LYEFLNGANAFSDLGLFPINLFAGGLDVDTGFLLQCCLAHLYSIDKLVRTGAHSGIIFGDLLEDGVWFSFVYDFSLYILVM